MRKVLHDKVIGSGVLTEKQLSNHRETLIDHLLAKSPYTMPTQETKKNDFFIAVVSVIGVALTGATLFPDLQQQYKICIVCIGTFVILVALIPWKRIFQKPSTARPSSVHTSATETRVPKAGTVEPQVNPEPPSVSSVTSRGPETQETPLLIEQYNGVTALLIFTAPLTRGKFIFLSVVIFFGFLFGGVLGPAVMVWIIAYQIMQSLIGRWFGTAFEENSFTPFWNSYSWPLLIIVAAVWVAFLRWCAEGVVRDLTETLLRILNERYGSISPNKPRN